ncbi:MAG: methyltransferase domain-containing protein [Rhodobacteraceae bacterium]|nr:methyltransferase domain-containing protein [Paracoccaceae bacterium]MCZ8085545.1 methyltransferase domain-containing protein [Paracoccaceae bacterium]
MDDSATMQWVLGTIESAPLARMDGAHLSMSAAEGIVAAALDVLRAADGDPVQLRYLTGHARRLAHTLTMIPPAPRSGARLLDVGCYGLMAYWAAKYLGYEEVVGIELLPDVAESIVQRRVEIGTEVFEFPVHNLNITQAEWPLVGPFDTVLLLETLEHVNEDPSGVLTRIVALLVDDGVLVASVPNCLSYRGLEEILTGAPPWVYWFFHPDLRHEPRHAFEYTPIFFKAILRAAGLCEEAFRTVCAYRDRTELDELFAIGALMSIPEELFGEVMITLVRKDITLPVQRHPAAIYDPDRYYEAIWPMLQPRKKTAIAKIIDALSEISRSRAEVVEKSQRLAQTEAQLAEALSLADEWRAQAREAVAQKSQRLAQTEAQLAEALSLADAWRAQAREAVAQKSRRRAQTETSEAAGRGTLERLCFRASGRPKRLLRRLLFHKSGRPRSITRRVVLHSDGRPRRAFHRWMASDSYRELPGAVRWPMG